MPVHDPQFWIVTAAALVAAGWLIFRATPVGKMLKRKKQQKNGSRATLTVGGRPVR